MTLTATTHDPFELNDMLDKPFQQKIVGLLGKPLDKVLGVQDLRRHYSHVSGAGSPDAFAAAALDELGISYATDLRRLQDIPKEGPLVIVANHPFGAVEGIVLAVALKAIRPDVKFMANYMLQRFPEFDDMVIPVDPFAREDSQRRNFGGLRDCMRWVKNGGALIVFPSGTVSHYQKRKHRVVDPEWSPSIGRIIQRTRAAVVPIYFEGHNNAAFQLAGMLHPRLRSLLIPRNLLNKKGKTIRFRIGSTVTARQLENFDDAAELTRYLRFRTYLLGAKRKHGRTFTIQDNPIVEPVPPSILEAEIADLPEWNHLLTSRNFEVYFAGSGQIPNVLTEIGRLREVSFRAVGEGTGKAVDLDEFDEYYTHLFVWDRQERQLVGAYRMGAMQQILEARGLEGLYTHQFFRYERSFFDRIAPALEMGRSFVQPQYQRQPSSLFLLWKGIGHYIARHPQYEILMGPVSISNDYQRASRDLIVEFLKSELYDDELAALVHPRKRYKLRSLGAAEPQTVLSAVHDIDEVSRWITDIDPLCHGVPILLKHYIKLGGRIAGFNVDSDFCEVLDALIMVDFTKVEPRQLAKYMGKENVDAYLDRN